MLGIIKRIIGADEDVGWELQVALLIVTIVLILILTFITIPGYYWGLRHFGAFG